METKEIEVGDLVFVQGRKHPVKQGWFDCYGTVVVVYREDDFDEDSDVEMITVRFEDSNTTEEYAGSAISHWDDKHKSWHVLGEQP